MCCIASHSRTECQNGQGCSSLSREYRHTRSLHTDLFESKHFVLKASWISCYKQPTHHCALPPPVTRLSMSFCKVSARLWRGPKFFSWTRLFGLKTLLAQGLTFSEAAKAEPDAWAALTREEEVPGAERYAVVEARASEGETLRHVYCYTRQHKRKCFVPYIQLLALKGSCENCPISGHKDGHAMIISQSHSQLTIRVLASL